MSKILFCLLLLTGLNCFAGFEVVNEEIEQTRPTDCRKIFPAQQDPADRTQPDFGVETIDPQTAANFRCSPAGNRSARSLGDLTTYADDLEHEGKRYSVVELVNMIIHYEHYQTRGEESGVAFDSVPPVFAPSTNGNIFAVDRAFWTRLQNQLKDPDNGGVTAFSIATPSLHTIMLENGPCASGTISERCPFRESLRISTNFELASHWLNEFLEKYNLELESDKGHYLCGLSFFEYIAVYSFTGFGYKIMQEPDSRLNAAGRIFKSIYGNALNSGLAKIGKPSELNVLFRGGSLHQTSYDNAVNGRDFSMGLMSTSAKGWVAAGFTNPDTTSSILKIKKVSSGSNIAPISNRPSEEEVIVKLINVKVEEVWDCQMTKRYDSDERRIEPPLEFRLKYIIGEEIPGRPSRRPGGL